jgi:hypothetical protein
MDGTVIRIAASTLANLPSGTPALRGNAKRIVATGLRTRSASPQICLPIVGIKLEALVRARCRHAP